jgi:hypothetical protein
VAHDHIDGHTHHHDAHTRGPGHNHPQGGALASYLHDADAAAELQVLTAQFIDGFREARDKTAYLRIAGVPFEIEDEGGGPSLKLVDVELKTDWQVGTASPSFGTRELSYLPYPGQMVTERTNMGFVFVSLARKRVWDLRDFLLARG